MSGSLVQRPFFRTSHLQAVFIELEKCLKLNLKNWKIELEKFIELMESATSCVEFSFNDTMYKQTDGVAMGSPLGPALANIFVGYHESKLFSCVQKPTIYFRYVDDTFAIFKQEGDVDDFLVTLNRLHPALKFTFEKKNMMANFHF